MHVFLISAMSWGQSTEFCFDGAIQEQLDGENVPLLRIWRYRLCKSEVPQLRRSQTQFDALRVRHSMSVRHNRIVKSFFTRLSTARLRLVID